MFPILSLSAGLAESFRRTNSTPFASSLSVTNLKTF